MTHSSPSPAHSRKRKKHVATSLRALFEKEGMYSNPQVSSQNFLEQSPLPNKPIEVYG